MKRENSFNLHDGGVVFARITVISLSRRHERRANFIAAIRNRSQTERHSGRGGRTEVLEGFFAKGAKA